MKIGVTILAVLLAAGGLWVRFQPARVTRVVHAQTGCSVASLVGSYGYSLRFYFDNAGNTNFFSASRIFTADGQGNTTGHESDSFSGQILQGDPIAGTYSVNSDCSGSITTNSMTSGSASYDFVLTNGLSQLQLVETDSGNNVTGHATRQ